MATLNDRLGEAPRFGARAWMAAAAGGALLIIVAVLAARGVDRAGIETAVSLTGRLAFAFFVPSYVGSALVTLFGGRFGAVKRQARSLGLGFATVIAIHLCLVGWQCLIGDAPPIATILIFGLAAAWVAGLAAGSIEAVSQAIGAPGWWVLRNIGMNYIALAFALDFLNLEHFKTPVKAIEYLPFAALSVLGPLLRASAWATRSLHTGASVAGAQGN